MLGGQLYDPRAARRSGEVDGQIANAPCGGEVAGKSPIDRGKLGIKCSRMTDRRGIPLGCVVTAANRHDSPFLRPTAEKLGRRALALPDPITVHLDAGYVSGTTRALLSEGGLRSLIPSSTSPTQSSPCTA